MNEYVLDMVIVDGIATDWQERSITFMDLEIGLYVDEICFSIILCVDDDGSMELNYGSIYIW
ncbi:hypothetical protein HN865_02080 [Candidatus Woesearchaeota archaeon]|jgi:hypothetical protein|nr:hypothetical protein [Candidatus Woesearchaeota archaeon]MBT6995429.1 hypothetical protein [Candidatus Woesearchaeota archaeon]MBT7237621.1 hypothetical protein [Candidatus Woesearchaeota archaeon]